MGKLVLVILAVAIAVGVWTTVDPTAQAKMSAAWSGVTTSLGVETSGLDAASLWAPIGAAFQNFADSVAGLLSPRSITISVPAMQVQP